MPSGDNDRLLKTPFGPGFPIRRPALSNHASSDSPTGPAKNTSVPESDTENSPWFVNGLSPTACATASGFPRTFSGFIEYLRQQRPFPPEEEISRCMTTRDRAVTSRVAALESSEATNTPAFSGWRGPH